MQGVIATLEVPIRYFKQKMEPKESAEKKADTTSRTFMPRKRIGKLPKDCAIWRPVSRMSRLDCKEEK